ncbi:MAG: GNAT family N-acetyltransferase [Planctomycetota bacterium]
MAEVVEINSPEELAGVRMAWNALLPQTPHASFFHTYDWLRLFWKHYGGERRLRVLVVRSCGETVGIVPLCVQRERHHFGEVRVLTYPLNAWGTWYGPISRNPAGSLMLAMEHVRRTPRDWDLIDLRWTPEAGDDRGRTEHAMRLAGLEPHTEQDERTSVIALEGVTWESYLASRSPKCRHEIRRQRRALEKDAGVVFARCRPAGAAEGDGEACPELFRQCVELSRRSWQGRVTNGNTLCHASVTRFLADCHLVAGRLGMLDICRLSIGDQPAAFSYNYHYHGAVFAMRMGYDPRVTRHGSGAVLLGMMIEDSIARGDRLIDLGIGEYGFKKRLRTAAIGGRRVSCYPAGAWRAQAVRLTQWLRRRRA